MFSLKIIIIMIASKMDLHSENIFYSIDILFALSAICNIPCMDMQHVVLFFVVHVPDMHLHPIAYTLMKDFSCIF